MPDEKKPLPRPPKTPFERSRIPRDNTENGPLMADQMAIAQREGKLDEFLEKVLKDSEHTRKLTSMMMGMTGMALPGGSSSLNSEKEESPGDERPVQTPDEERLKSGPSEDVLNAAQSGNVEGLIELLKKEHSKRTSPGEDVVTDERTSEENIEIEGSSNTEGRPMEEAIRDQLTWIASEHNVSVDKVILRALLLYIQEYLKTGRF
jgi:hypothetical protein